MNAFAADGADDFLTVLAQLDALKRDIGMRLDDPDDVALCDIAVEAEQQVGRRQMEKVQRVALQYLTEVHEFAQFLGRGRESLRALDAIDRLAGSQMMADWANPTEPLHDDRHVPVRPPLYEALETAKLDNVQARLANDIVIIGQQRNLAVPFDARDRLDHDAVQVVAVLCGFARHVAASIKVQQVIRQVGLSTVENIGQHLPERVRRWRARRLAVSRSRPCTSKTAGAGVPA